MLKSVIASVFLLTSVLLAQRVSRDEITGLYSFVHSGETVQINVQPDGRVTGYVSRVGDGESDRGQVLDLMFASAALHGDRLEFRTRKIHGEWFQFSGEVAHGNGKSPADEGYLVIRGKLIANREDDSGNAHPQETSAEFRSLPSGM